MFVVCYGWLSVVLFDEVVGLALRDVDTWFGAYVCLF